MLWTFNRIALAILGVLFASGIAVAQTEPRGAPHVQLQKTIGQSQSSQPQVFPSLIVMNARGASMQAAS
jgi:hypothetical protein